MGKDWDAFVPQPALWKECFRVLKPGGYLLSFFGTRIYDWGTLAIRLAGFEIRDCIQWIYGSGFPKSMDVSKAIDKYLGQERKIAGYRNYTIPDIKGNAYDQPHVSDRDRIMAPITMPTSNEAKQWEGWGTALKPANEPICVARKPLIGTVAENVMVHGTGAINIDECRIGRMDGDRTEYGVDGDEISHTGDENTNTYGQYGRVAYNPHSAGRWPANVIHDGSNEVLKMFPETTSGAMKQTVQKYEGEGVTGFLRGNSGPHNQHGDSGLAARFFYCAKASKSDRGEGNDWPTVKPVSLMRYLVRLVTPKGGVCLDPFCGSGTTGEACIEEGVDFIIMDQNDRAIEITRSRIDKVYARKLSQEALDLL